MKRIASNPIIPNQYQQGDFVLFDKYQGGMKNSKLSAPFGGPYEVIKHDSNNVEARHVAAGFIKIFHTSRLKLFIGSKDDAYKTALLDINEHVVKQFLAYRGNPTLRTSIQFLVEFEDGKQLWLPWSQDLFTTVPYENFCRSKPCLYVLLFSHKEALKILQRKNREPITLVKPGDFVYVDLRSYGPDWYDQLQLPDSDSKTYVLHYEYLRWNNEKQTKIIAFCKLFDETFSVDGYFVYAYGSAHQFDPGTMVLIDKSLVSRFPALLPKKSK